MTNRITDNIKKFKPSFYNIPINKREMEEVVDRLYKVMFPNATHFDTASIHKELHSIAEILLSTIAQLT